MDSWLITGAAAIAGVVLIVLCTVTAIVALPFLYDYEVDGHRLRIFVLGCFTVARFRVARFEDVYLLERGRVPKCFFNPFRTLRLGNRIRDHRVVIVRGGILKTLILTPVDPEQFVDDICAAKNDSISAAGERGDNGVRGVR